MYKTKKYQYLIKNFHLSEPNSSIDWNSNKKKGILFQSHCNKFSHEIASMIKKEIDKGLVLLASSFSFYKFNRNTHGFFDV